MQDPDLKHLLVAMDAMVGWAEESVDVSEEVDRLSRRLECLGRRFGNRASESPYLQFLRRNMTMAQTNTLAASA